jgi:hypothetical protein
MSRLTATGLALVLALGVAAAPAPARHRPAASNPVAEAVKRAVAFWHGVPCAGQVHVAGAPPSEAPAAGQSVPGLAARAAAMWATWHAPTGTAPPSTYSQCVVYVNRTTWPDWRTEDAGFATFCKEMVHEYGHFEGYSDAGAVPRTIQYERPDLARLPICERFRLLYGHEVFTGRPR